MALVLSLPLRTFPCLPYQLDLNASRNNPRPYNSSWPEWATTRDASMSFNSRVFYTPSIMNLPIYQMARGKPV
jgi:hypothetical protein